MIRLIYVILVVLALLTRSGNADASLDPDSYLEMGDQAFKKDEISQAVQYYKDGIQAVSKLEEGDVSLLTEIALHVNLATAFGTTDQKEEAMLQYRKALTIYKDTIDDIIESTTKKEASDIAAQASFFLGMEYQDMGQYEAAIQAYGFAFELDPYHWGAAANLGSVLQDHLNQHREAIVAYNKAYAILTQTKDASLITDPPGEPRYILSQLQHRMGLCIIHNPSQKCSVSTDPTKQVSCQEMAAHAFSLAVKFDPSNEIAKHMLATVTADATVERASNTFVKSLFDDYAHNFEHSLVEELGYTGYQRLRREFDRAMEMAKPKSYRNSAALEGPKTKDSPYIFPLVVDAGCGTGLVGEQFRNVSNRLIGVDLSEAILLEAEKARPGLYEETVVGDLTDVYRDKAPIDLIVAADSYIYFGDLVPLFESMYDGLKVGGFAAFTLENVGRETQETLQASKPDWRWQLTASGRFAHNKAYIEATATSLHFKVVHYEELVDFRYERGVGVMGHIFILQKEKDEPDL